jgi:hypothetical protein
MKNAREVLLRSDKDYLDGEWSFDRKIEFIKENLNKYDTKKP